MMKINQFLSKNQKNKITNLLKKLKMQNKGEDKLMSLKSHGLIIYKINIK